MIFLFCSVIRRWTTLLYITQLNTDKKGHPIISEFYLLNDATRATALEGNLRGYQKGVGPLLKCGAKLIPYIKNKDNKEVAVEVLKIFKDVPEMENFTWNHLQKLHGKVALVCDPYLKRLANFK